MDSQHRHELQQNDLRKMTNQALPFFEKYGVQIAVALLIAVAIGGIGAWWYSASATSSAESWTQLDHALHKPTPSAGDYADVADRHRGTVAAAWANLNAAEDYLKSGMQAAFTNHEASVADLQKAQEGFQKLEAGGPGVTPEIRERALFGLARCLESTSDGNTDDAIKVYSRIVTDFSDSMFKGIAQDRIKSLESKDAKDFYAWFHQQKPEPKDPHPFPMKKSTDGATSEPIDAEETLDLSDPAVETPASEKSTAPETTDESSSAPTDDTSKAATEKPEAP